jgi:hypothetical protein
MDDTPLLDADPGTPSGHACCFHRLPDPRCRGTAWDRKFIETCCQCGARRQR